MSVSTRCDNCRFWCEEAAHRAAHEPGWSWGSCRRRPPVLVECIVEPLMPQPRYGEAADPDMDSLALAPATRFPGTHSSDWCGEHQERAS